MRKKIFAIGVLIFLALIPSTFSLDGKFFDGARENYGEIYNPEGEGEYISNIYKDRGGKVLRGVRLSSTLKNNSNATLIIESSKNNFESISDQEKFRIQENKKKYFINRELNGKYRRYRIEMEGEVRISPEIKMSSPPFNFMEEYKYYLIFVLTFGAGFMIMRLKDYISSDKSKTLILLTFSLLFITPLVSGLGDIYVGDNGGNLKVYRSNGTLAFSKNFDYRIGEVSVMGDDSVIVNEINGSFYGSNIDLDNQLSKLYKINTSGAVEWSVRLDDLTNQYIHEPRDVETYENSVFYGARTCSNKDFPDRGFNNGVDNCDVDVAVIMKLYSECLRKGGSRDLCIDKKEFDDLSYRDDLVNDIELDQEYLYYINEEGSQSLRQLYQKNLTLKREISVTNDSLMWDEDLDLAFNSTSAIDEFGNIKHKYPFSQSSGDFAGFTNTKYYLKEGGELKVYDQDCLESDTIANCLDWSIPTDDERVIDTDEIITEQGSYLQSRGEDGIPNWNITLTNDLLDIEIKRFPFVDINITDYFELIYPEDESGFTSDAPPSVLRFKYLVPQIYDGGKIQLQIKESDSSLWNTYREGLGLEDRDGECSLDLGGEAWTWNECYGHTLELTDVEDITSNFATGKRVDWRIKYKNNHSSDSDKEGDVLFSPTRTFRIIKAYSFIRARSPINETTLLTLKPEFKADIYTQQEGEVELNIDGSVQKTWSLKGGFRGTLSYTPPNGLSEGSHTYEFIFRGGDGINRTTGVRNFNINTSLASDYQFELKKPEDGFKTKNRSLQFLYDINTSESGTLKLLLDNEVETTNSITPGNYENLTTSVYDISTGEHTWSLIFEDPNRNISVQSGSNNFKILEDVLISSLQPNDAETIAEPPVIFKADLTTNTDGFFRLHIDGSVRESETVDAGFNGTKTVQIDKNLSSGKHTFKFSIDTPDGRFETDVREFTLRVGTKGEDDLPEGGVVGGFASVWEDLFGINTSQSLMFTALLFSIAFSLMVGGLTKQTTLSALTFVGVLGAFSVMEWVPPYFLVVITVLAGYLLAREMSSSGG